VRIVGGKFRGRSLHAPRSTAIRPTSDRLRETIFNILEHGFEHPCPGARVIDLFAGTGAMGFEALSRGAAHVLFVDQGAEARAVIRANVEALGVGGVTRLFRRDATKLGDAPTGPPFTLAFLDPPYGRGLAGQALAALAEGAWLARDALCVVEEEAEAKIELPAAFTSLDQRVYGDTQIMFCVSMPGSMIP
jgi:16S rRNA (guanine966-N2)-methyltransferase